MVSVFLLDDERSAITVLKHKLLKNFPEEIEISGISNDPEEALAILVETQVDLLFLDIEMPGMSGLEFLEKIPERRFDVIFTTAYQKYAIEAIRKNAFDYLVKPIDESDLRVAIERALEKKRMTKTSKPEESDLLSLAQSLLKAQSSVAKLSVPTIEGLLLVPVADIIRIEGGGSYATIITVSKQKIIASKNLSEFEEMLSRYPQFFRVHKSHLINLNHVVKYIRGEGGSVIMSDGSEAEVARRRKDEFLSKL